MSTGLFQDEEDGYNLEENDNVTTQACGDCQAGGTNIESGDVCTTCGGEGHILVNKNNLEEETKYKIKLDAPKSEPALPASDDEGLDSFEDAGDDLGFGDESGKDDDKPFDDEPFDAGVEADEDEDPEKFIQQLAGKLGTSLRKYNDERGEPDFDLEKYVINSVVSASHTSEMDEEDQKDIIRKIKTSGAESDVDSSDDSLGIDDEEGSEEPAKDGGDEFEFEDLDSKEELDESDDYSNDGYDFSEEKKVIEVIKRLRDTGMELTVDNVIVGSLFNPGGTVTDENLVKAVLDVYSSHVEESMTASEIEEDGMYEESWSEPMEISEGVKVSDGLQYHLDNKIALGEGIFRYGSDKYVELYTEVKELKDKGLITLNENDEALIEDFTNQTIVIEGETILLNLIIENNGEYIIEEGDRYKGKKTNSPTRGAGGGKAYTVFVPGCAAKTKSNPRGIKKVSFGSGGLKAKLSNKEAKKSYNARHGCSKGRHNDKCKAGYWSCRLPRYAKKLGLSGGGTWW